MVGPANTVNLSGASLTVGTLEAIVKVANEHGEVLITNVGHSSLMLLAADLIAYARTRK